MTLCFYASKFKTKHTYSFILILNIFVIINWFCINNTIIIKKALANDTGTNEMENILPITSIDILFCCNEQSKPGLYALINSIIIHHTFEPNEYLYFHILVREESYIYKQEFELLFSNFIHNQSMSIKYDFKSFSEYKNVHRFRHQIIPKTPTNRRLKNVMNYARFYLPLIFNDITDTAIYLDVDTIVRDDISLLKKELETNNECVLMGAFDYVELYRKMFNIKNKEGLKLIGLDLDNINLTNTFGFNAGVVVYNLSYWRMNNYTQKVENILKINKELELNHQPQLFTGCTQPIMNILYNNDVVNPSECSLDDMWNARSLGLQRLSRGKWFYVKENAKILHWTGPHKPWLKFKRPSKFFHADLWRQYLPMNFNNSTIQTCYWNWDVC